MQRVSLNVFAAVLTSLVLLGFSSLAVYADFNPNPNPNNRGHHYGWLRHNHTPTPTPTPAPGPTPAPVGSGTQGSGVVTSGHRSSGSQSGVGLAGAVPHLNLGVLQLVPTRQTGGADVNPVQPPQGGDPWWWLVLVLLPALAALWAIAFRRVLVGRPAAGGGPATAPA